MSKQHLHLTPPDAPLTPTEKAVKTVKQKSGYESPIGWWKVSTEGDVEGRSTTPLGTFYGHVAEIALHLADKCYYALDFTATTSEQKGRRVTYKATASAVWVRLNIKAGTWDMSGERRAEFLATWFNTDDVVVTPSTKYATYFGASYVSLKKEK